VFTLAAPRTSLEDNWSSSPPFRLVLPRHKRDRLAAHVAALRQRQVCAVPGCAAEGMPVVLVEAEQTAVLCPVTPAGAAGRLAGRGRTDGGDMRMVAKR
jgi:hypothetical protein